MSKYKKIQREKLSGKSLEIYDKLKKASNNFENTEGKIGEALDKFYNKVEKTAVEVEKKVEPKKAAPKKSTAKKSTPKKTTKKKTTKKKTASKKPSYKNVNQGSYAKLASKIMKEKGISYREAQKEASKIFAEEKKAKREAKAKSFSKSVTAFKKKYGGKGTRNTDVQKDADIPAKPVGKRVSKSGKVYYEYRDNRTDQKQPQPTDKPRLAKGGTIMSTDIKEKIFDENGERKIDKKSIEILTDYVNSLEQTKSANQKDGKYTPSRKKLHGKIIEKFKDGVVCIDNNKPIAILMGGSPASGKSTFLKEYAPYLLKDEILRIDADEVRAMLPEYEGWNASQTHLETKDIVNTLLSDRTIGLPCETDIIYDGTMNSNKSYLPLIKLLRKMDYKIFVVYIDKVPKDVIVDRALNRYKSSGRFVPLEVIDDFFDKGKDALNEIKKKVDGYMIVDGSGGNYKVIEEGGIKLPKTRKYGKIGSPMKKKMEFGGDIAKSYDVRPPYGTYAKGGKVEFRKLAKSKNFDIVTPDGRYEIEMGALGMPNLPKSIIVDGHRQDINSSPIAKKYRNEIQSYLDDNYAKGGKIDDLGNPTDPKVIAEMEKFIKEEKPKLDKDRFFTDGMRRKEAKRKFYKKYEYGAYNPRFSFFAKGGKVSDKRQRVAEFLVEMNLDNGFYDEELDRDYGTTTYQEAYEWELKNNIKTDKDAEAYIDENGYLMMAKGGKMKRDWSTYYNDGGMVEGYDVRSPYGTYAEGGTLPIGYHRMPDGEIMADSEHFAKGGYVCMNCGEYAMGGKVKTTKRKKRKR